jgi:phosphoenolpyruvate carboxykinase (ATP)
VLLEHAVRRGEGRLTADGAFVGMTAPHTGRSPDDKFVVREPSSEDDIWWGKVNVALRRAKFDALRRTCARISRAGAVRHGRVGGRRSGAPAERARRSARARGTRCSSQHVHRAAAAERADFEPGFTILHAPEFEADPARHGTRSSTFVVLNFASGWS